MTDLTKFEILQLLSLYGDILKELKKRGAIRGNNLVGDIGEYFAVDFYNKTKNLPKLQLAAESTKNFDAIGNNGKRYTIKCTTNKTTGVFYGIEKDSELKPALFEHVIVVVLNEYYKPELILELDWETFNKFKRWHSRMKAFNLTITNKLKAEAKIIYENSMIESAQRVLFQ